jgi:hypothetical protein
MKVDSSDLSDLNALVLVVRVEPRFAGQNPLVLGKYFPKEVKEAVLSAFKEGVVNEDTDLLIGMSGRDFHEHFDIEDDSSAMPHLEAIAFLPELMRSAKRVETYQDKKPSQGSNIEKMHRFISAFSDGTGDYAVLLTVKEYAPGKYIPDKENPMRLYHHRVEKRMPSVTSASSPVEQAASSTTPNIKSYTIRRLVEGVKDSQGKIYF